MTKPIFLLEPVGGGWTHVRQNEGGGIEIFNGVPLATPGAAADRAQRCGDSVPPAVALPWQEGARNIKAQRYPPADADEPAIIGV